jgi:hypothetical protein
VAQRLDGVSVSTVVQGAKAKVVEQACTVGSRERSHVGQAVTQERFGHGNLVL